MEKPLDAFALYMAQLRPIRERVLTPQQTAKFERLVGRSRSHQPKRYRRYLAKLRRQQ